jgi:hypothetical protein
VTEAQVGKGICKRGMAVCKGAQGIVCEGCVGPQKEICNGIDDDCNGLVDDGIDGVGRPCACEGGVPLMTLMTGECKPGRAVCKGKEPLDCEGCQAPKPELCDCKDNNCNGMNDEGKTCETGFVCLRNAAKGVCECQPECGTGEFPCPPGLYCDMAEKPPVCKSARCAGKICLDGFACDEGDGQCKDMCANVKCAEPKVCKAGRCVDCYTEGCPAGLVCRDSRCEKNPCEGKKCGPVNGIERFCNEQGQCESLCLPQCAPGLECIKGKCEKNNCSDKSCPQGDVCDPRTGKCEPNQCLLKACGSQACVPLTGECKDNPCATVKCPECYACLVTPDGVGSCQLVQACYPEDVMITNKGSGCACGVGGGGLAALPLLPLLPLLGLGLGMAVARRRRRR